VKQPELNAGGMSDLPRREPAAEMRRQLELAKYELDLALMFAKASSNAYVMGKLQHASDTRAKAEAARARAMAQLIAAASGSEGEEAIQSMLGDVQNALDRLPSSNEPYFWMRTMRAGS
jgi:hypothetical protein